MHTELLCYVRCWQSVAAVCLKLLGPRVSRRSPGVVLCKRGGV